MPSEVPAWTRNFDRGRPALDIQHVVMQSASGDSLKIVASTQEALLATTAQVQSYVPLLGVSTTEINDAPPAVDVDEIQTAVHEIVTQINDLVDGHDAFDVMAMLHQFLMPPDMALHAESEAFTSDTWAAAEVIALVLVGNGLVERDPAHTERTAAIIPRLVELGGMVVQLAMVVALTESEPGSNETQAGLSSMALRLRSHEIAVRGRQYDFIADAINNALLDQEATTKAFQKELGFTYADVIAIRGEVARQVAERFNHAWTTIAKAASTNAPPDDDFRAAAQTLWEHPGTPQTITTAELSDALPQLSAPQIQAVLDTFSVRPDGRTSESLILSFVHGRNPMWGLSMLHAPGRGYLPLPGAIALDEIRRVCEAKIKGTTSWTRYGESRDKAVERLVASTIRDLVGGDCACYEGLRYRDPQSGHDLSRDSTTQKQAPLTEADTLVVLGSVAICVEVKAGSIRQPSRQGRTAHLGGDLQKTISKAANQADRLRNLITTHQGLWLHDGKWLDLSTVQEVHTVVVCLDDLGPLALSTSNMVRSGILPQTRLPWVVSLHDLLVVKDVLNRPEHFLTYLRRRTSRDAALWVTGSDELDLLMWFVGGDFYFTPDPDKLHDSNPSSKPPTAKMRREYAEQGRTVVGTLTDSLDAYYYWVAGSSSHEADIPRRSDLPAELRAITDEMRRQGAPGWWETASDLDGYSAAAQRNLATNLQLIKKQTKQDGQFHSIAQGGTDETGHWVHIVATGKPTRANLQHLQDYVAAKKHLEGADRALGVLLNGDGLPVATVWLCHPRNADPGLDALARAMKLVPPDRAPRAIPPSVKRKRKKQGEKRKSR